LVSLVHQGLFGVRTYILQACESNSAEISPETDDCVEFCRIHITHNQNLRYICVIIKNIISQTMYLTAHKSFASTIVPGFRPMLDQDAVTVAFDELLFHKITATLLSLRGPAHTCHNIYDLSI